MFTLNINKVRKVAVLTLALFTVFALAVAFLSPFANTAYAGDKDHGYDGDMVVICHYPDGDLENPETIETEESYVIDHEDHDKDYLGECYPQEPEEPEPILGSITVCKIAVNEEGTLISGETGSSFAISGIARDDATGVLPESLFETPLAYNTDILSDIEGDDALCLSYNDLELGGYYYSEEIVSGENWLTPLYNDQFTTTVNTLTDFFAYSGELFTPDTADDEVRNTNSDGHITLNGDRTDRTLVVLNRFETPEPVFQCSDGIDNDDDDLIDNEDPACYIDDVYDPELDDESNDPVVTEVATLSATKIVCEDESYLPNWGDGSVSLIDENTATDFLTSVNSEETVCALEEWDFQWAPQGTANPGDNTGEDVGDWTTFSGTTAIDLNTIEGDEYVWVREVWNNLYIPFTGVTTTENISAELYGHIDALNYDNYDRIDGIEAGETYHIVAFNVPVEVPPLPQCSDGINNDTEDILVDYPADPGCESPEDDNETDPVPPTQCSDGIDNNDPEDTLADTLDPACHTDGDPTNQSSYDPTIDDETDPIIGYAPYCGDGIVNQTWEQCDGGIQCSEQCQNVDDNQCRDLSLARVNVTTLENHSNGDVTSDIFLGSVLNKIPSGAWFSIWENGTYTTDADITPYEDVAGLAIERQVGNIRTVLFGSHGPDGSKEHIQGNIEFFNATTTSQTSDNTGNNKLENGFDLVMDNVPGQDEVWIDDDVSYFWLTVTTADDGFNTLYEEPIMCPLTLPQCSDNIDNDEDGFTDAEDLTCSRGGIYDPTLDNEENQKPVILLTGNSTIDLLVGDDYTEQGATADDFEDGDITGDVVIGGDTVATSTPGTYNVTYNVSDSESLAADEVTRTVTVSEDEPPLPQCSDGLDNDEDEYTDEEDPTCSRDGEYDPTLDNEENQKPVISLNGGSVELFVGGSYAEEGATADDFEDGNGLEVTDLSGSIDVNTPGDYTVFYNFSDSEGLGADEVSRTVTVKSQGGGGAVVLSFGGGGGGGGPIQPSLHITNEAVISTVSGLAVVTWNTNLPASSQVLYDTESNLVVGPAPDYGYANASTEISALTTDHTVIISGIDAGEQNYFRPISKSSTLKAIGIELALLPGVQTITAPTQCTYLEDYLRLGGDNDPDEVTKLQTFLRDFEGFTELEVTGIFDQTTFDAVSAFQERYGDEVLTPWGLPSTTGYVYYTTQKKVNEIYCQSAFPLTDTQQNEINSFSSLIDSLRAGGATDEDIEVILENLGTTGGGTGAGLAIEEGNGEGVEGEESVAAVALLDRFPQASNLVAGVFTLPDDITGLYDCLIDLLLILFIIAILWLITKETVLYRDGDPAKGRLERDRTVFFSIAMLIAVIVSALLEIYCTILPLIVIFIALVIYYFVFTKKKISE